MLAIDANDWDAIGELFSDRFYHDRTSLTGGEPYAAPVAQFVGWRQTLQALDHQITNHVISLGGERLLVRRTCRARTCSRTRRVVPIWTVGGRHVYQLKRTLRLADFRIDLHPPMGERQHERPEPGDRPQELRLRPGARSAFAHVVRLVPDHDRS